MKGEVERATANYMSVSFVSKGILFSQVLTLFNQLEDPPIDTPLARRPRGKTSEMMIHATGPHLSV